MKYYMHASTKQTVNFLHKNGPRITPTKTVPTTTSLNYKVLLQLLSAIIFEKHHKFVSF